jgi:hypothetical protein
VKKIILVLAIIIANFTIEAQVKHLSLVKIYYYANCGLTDVEIVYSDQAQEAESFWFDSFWKSLENGQKIQRYP